jgi:hypothetical protein
MKDDDWVNDRGLCDGEVVAELFFWRWRVPTVPTMMMMMAVRMLNKTFSAEREFKYLGAYRFVV